MSIGSFICTKPIPIKTIKLHYSHNEILEDNGTKKVIAVIESMNVCLKSVEASFQMIIDLCEFAIPALYQLD